MGYNLYITRRRDWSDTESPISLEEWKQLIASDAQLFSAPKDPCSAFFINSDLDWLTWSKGYIYSKNPSESLIQEMTKIAESLNAKVLGEDGEVYQRNGVRAAPQAPTIGERLRRWWNERRYTEFTPVDDIDPPFRRGDRVKDIFGDQCQGTVRSVAAMSRNDLGLIVVDYDDGRVGKRYCIGHGLELVESPPEAFDANE